MPVLDKGESQALRNAAVVVVEKFPVYDGGDGRTDAKRKVAEADLQVVEAVEAREYGRDRRGNVIETSKHDGIR